MSRAWVLHIHDLITQIEALIDGSTHSRIGSCSFVSVPDMLKEILGYAVGYHQPEDYHDSDLFRTLIDLNIPTITAMEICIFAAELFTNRIKRQCGVYPHYTTLNLALSQNNRVLVVSEDIYLEPKDDAPIHHSGYPVHREIEWAKRYNND